MQLYNLYTTEACTLGALLTTAVHKWVATFTLSQTTLNSELILLGCAHLPLQAEAFATHLESGVNIATVVVCAALLTLCCTLCVCLLGEFFTTSIGWAHISFCCAWAKPAGHQPWALATPVRHRVA